MFRALRFTWSCKSGRPDISGLRPAVLQVLIRKRLARLVPTLRSESSFPFDMTCTTNAMLTPFIAGRHKWRQEIKHNFGEINEK